MGVRLDVRLVRVARLASRASACLVRRACSVRGQCGVWDLNPALPPQSLCARRAACVWGMWRVGPELCVTVVALESLCGVSCAALCMAPESLCDLRWRVGAGVGGQSVVLFDTDSMERSPLPFSSSASLPSPPIFFCPDSVSVSVSVSRFRLPSPSPSPFSVSVSVSRFSRCNISLARQPRRSV